MDFGSRIRAARRAAGLSQEELARRAGMSLKGMGDIERGDIEDPHYSSLSKIADGLGMSIGALLEEDPASPKGPAPASPPDVTGEARRARPFEMVLELVTRQSEEDRQAIARGHESSFPQVSHVRYENEARDRLLQQYHPADVAEAYVDLVKQAEWLKQELERVQGQLESTREVPKA